MKLQDDLRSLADHAGGGDAAGRGGTLLLDIGATVAARVPPLGAA